MTKEDTRSAFERLNLKQQRFVLAYLRLVNATQAAKEAGYSAKTAGSQGHDLLKRPDVATAIQEQKQAQFRRLHMDADELLALIAQQARNPIANMIHVTPDGDPYLDLNKASAADLQHITEVTIEDFTDGREIDDEGNIIKRDVRKVKVKIASPDAARTTLAKHLNLLKDTVKIEADGTFASVMAAALQRADGGKNGTDD